MRYLCMLFLIISGCSRSYPSKNEVFNLLNSNSKDEILLGVYYAGKYKDTIFIHDLMSHIHNPQVSHNKRFYGMSVHKGVVIALTKITGVSPPNPITYEVDSANIEFFKQHCKKQ